MLKPNDRCQIVKSLCGDEMKIVVVDGYFDASRELFDDIRWEKENDVLVTSLGSPLHALDLLTLEVTVHQTRPYPHDWLRKMPTVEETVEEAVEEPVLIGR